MRLRRSPQATSALKNSPILLDRACLSAPTVFSHCLGGACGKCALGVNLVNLRTKEAAVRGGGISQFCSQQ